MLIKRLKREIMRSGMRRKKTEEDVQRFTFLLKGWKRVCEEVKELAQGHRATKQQNQEFAHRTA